MDVPRISSRQHPFVRRCRDAADRRVEGVVLLDGEHLLAEALNAGVTIEAVLTDDRPRALIADIDRRGIARYSGGDGILAAASPVRTPSGVVALASWSPGDLRTVLGAKDAFVVGMAGVQDPGNAGGIIRSAHALGATGVLALDGTADLAHWKVLRGAMGSTFKLLTASGSVEDLVRVARKDGVPLVAAVAHGGSSPDEIAFTRPMVLLLGNEGQGLPQRLLDQAIRRVRVPLEPGAESLNVGATVAILLWEARRRMTDQRRTADA